MYNLSIGAIFKNEAPYLKEWLDHYIIRGVDHFYLINDNSDDYYLDVLNEYKKYITLFNVDECLEKEGRQKSFYNKFFHPIKHETKWFCICDIDEYIWSPQSTNFNDILIILEDKKINSLLINMILFGSNGLIKQPKSIVNSFTKRQDLNVDYIKFALKYDQYKSISLAENIQKFQIHRFISTYEKDLSPPQWNKLRNIPIYIEEKNETFFFQERQNLVNLNSNFFRLNHYRLQSEERWMNDIMKKKCVNRYAPKNLGNFSPNLNKENNTLNYKTIELFNESNKIQNDVEDLGLINQNNLIYSK